MNDALERLCRAAGIAGEYHDIWGHLHHAPEASRRELLAAMGIDPSDPERALRDLEDRPWRRAIPPVVVHRVDERPYRLALRLPEAAVETTHTWQLALEDGTTLSGTFFPRDLEHRGERHIDGVRHVELVFEWHDALPTGYHRYTLTDAAGESWETSYVVAPGRCYLPPALEAGEKVWGVAVQLYGVRSTRNWGIGDFTDLRTLTAQWVRHGASLIGVNPLHALFPHNPAHTSPYSPSSRLFLNVLYIDVEAVEDLRESMDLTVEVNSADFRARVTGARDAEFVDYETVSRLKLPLLERLYRHFREHHLSAGTVRARAFRSFQERRGRELRLHALFEALQEALHRADNRVWGWPAWPDEYRDPQSEAVQRFERDELERIEFYEYLQWQADEQLARAAARAQDLDAGVGLYVDLSISIDCSGAEAWAHQQHYALGVSVGAPPDEINRSGQNWGLPPLLPERLRDAAYAPYIATLRANMRSAGALRIDHVMGLARLFWIPNGREGSEGAYVYYPFEDLLAIVALESHRNRCMVIGEDLGTVPDEVRAGLGRSGVLSYRLLYFERDGKGDFRPPAEYPVDALVAATTHDLPTLSGFWNARDIELRHMLGVYPDDAVREQQLVQRASDRAKLIVALEREQLVAPGTVNPLALSRLTPDLARTIYLYLARTPSRALAVQMEDVLGVGEAPNLPGTTTEHPNWRRKLPEDLERIVDDSRFTLLTRTLAEARPRQYRGSERKELPLRAVIPRATYRVQLNADFTFAHATAIVRYLAALGVSHVYCSPYLKARPGSTHGYDIIDHNALNPEIGTRADFERFVATLRAHGMGHVLDMVPNHMGVMGADNEWWLDVLENGRASAYARYFDIEWRPAASDLVDRVLLPVLGDHYGTVLERGEIRLAYDPELGAFSAHYYHHRFPIDPRCYAEILEGAQTQLDTGDAPVMEQLASLAAAFRNLPDRSELDTIRINERRRDKELHKQRLASLGRGSDVVRGAVERTLRGYNGRPGSRESFDALHQLLDRQAYRLAFWRAASDEINYRRFFDINDLAALRMEEEGVFEATHRMVMNLAVDGKVDALRIDHPDGLYDPATYFRELQERYAALAGGVLTPDAADHPPRALYVVAEKIAAPHEHLPTSWAVYGTTGYRFASVVNGLFVDGAAARDFDRIYEAYAPEASNYEDVVYESKRVIMRGGLASPLTMLATELLRIARMDTRTRDYTLNGLRQALLEIVACFPVYRTYISDAPSEQDRRYVDWAVSHAKRRARSGELNVFDFVRRAMLAEAPQDADADMKSRLLDFAMKTQQFTAPVAAKGVEDTAFYRYNRLVSLNEVGGEPRDFGMTVSAFHGASADRARVWPHTMLATSTHDNKRSEDVRARIDVLSEMPAEWRLMLRRWSRMNRNRKRECDGTMVPAGNEEYLLYQTLVGSLPSEMLDDEALAAYRDRICAYMIKAVREAKLHSSWINVNAEYEQALVAFIGQLLGKVHGNLFLDDLRRQTRTISWFGALNGISMMLVKLTSPGVPDIYQGTELIDLSLVDPDNRRPVDYARRARLLEGFRAFADGGGIGACARELARTAEDGRAKLWTIWRALDLRRRQPDVFEQGGYQALHTSGARSDHLVAYARRHGDEAVVAIAGRLWAKLGGPAGTVPLGPAFWGDTAVDLSPLRAMGSAVNVLTGTPVQLTDEGLRIADTFSDFPGALIYCKA
ncbi:MAG: malto-oligosyltrehalose synthase [Rhodospirillaceae bacterium]